MPTEDGVGSDDGGNLGQELPPERLAQPGEPDSLGVGEPDAPLAELPEDLVLFDEVLDHTLLMAVDPAREQGEEEDESRVGRFRHGSKSVEGEGGSLYDSKRSNSRT